MTAPAANDAAYRRADRSVYLALAGALLVIGGTLLASWLAGIPVLPDRPPGALPRMPMGGAGSIFLHGVVGPGSLGWYGYLLSVPAFLLLARRIAGRRWAVSIAICIVAVFAASALTGYAEYALLFWAPPRPRGLLFIEARAAAHFLPFLGVAAAAQAFELFRSERRRAFETEQLRAELLEARLEALTTRLRPHFLFNTLQGISTLMHRDVEAADRMLAGLSDLLRATFSVSQSVIPLEQELTLIAQYLDITELRFAGRVRTDLSVSDDAKCALVPFFVLQPLVENAIEHGIERSRRAGTIRIIATRDDRRLLLQVSDDGPGIPTDPGAAEISHDERPASGIGLKTTRDRLRQLYGDACSMDVTSTPPSGTVVTVRIPYRPANGSTPG